MQQYTTQHNHTITTYDIIIGLYVTPNIKIRYHTMYQCSVTFLGYFSVIMYNRISSGYFSPIKTYAVSISITQTTLI